MPRCYVCGKDIQLTDEYLQALKENKTIQAIKFYCSDKCKNEDTVNGWFE